MRKVRVLVVDDSVVVRRMVTDVLSSDPLIEVVGAAANGRIALAKIPQVNPDLITLDIEMPEMDGLEALRAIRETYPTLPVIMFSTLTERGAAATLEALSLGANDYVTKPSNVGKASLALDRISEELIPKIKVFCATVVGPNEIPDHPVPATEPVRLRPVKDRPKRQKPEIVAIGISTGGPTALFALLPTLPADFPAPVVIVQHMPPMFTALLAERLASLSAVTVSEATIGESLEPGHVWIAPGDYHIALARDGNSILMRTHQGPPENSCRPSVDVLFRSVAEVYGPRSLAVVMTGMGKDGLRGCEDIHEVGGQVVVQDEASSVVWGMPGFVAQAGLADNVLPLDRIGPEIIRRVGRA